MVAEDAVDTGKVSKEEESKYWEKRKKELVEGWKKILNWNSVFTLGVSIAIAFIIKDAVRYFVGDGLIRIWTSNIPLAWTIYDVLFVPIIAIIWFFIILSSGFKWDGFWLSVIGILLFIYFTRGWWWPPVINIAFAIVPQLNLLLQWTRPTEIGCRDCLQLTFNTPPSILVEGNDYLFSVDLKNNDCPIQEDQRQCTGKTLKDIKVTGKAFDEKETSGETYSLGDLEPSGETSKVIKIGKDKITSDIFDRKVFYLSVLSAYTIETTANAQIAIYQTAKDRLAAGKISEATTHAGPVDIGMNFKPNKISIQETTEVPLELDFLLVESGTATIESLEVIQHGDQTSRLQLLGCTKNGQSVDVVTTSEPTQEKYVFSMSELDRLSNYGSEVVLCNFAVSSATESSPLTFESASNIRYHKEDVWSSEIELQTPSAASSSSSSTSSTLPTGAIS